MDLRFQLRVPLRQASRLSPLISALGISIALQNGTMVVVSPAPRFLPNILETSPVSIFGLATIQNKQLQPGAQKALWDGRLWTGSLAFSGAYQVHVVAANSIGAVSLVAPFTARR